MPTYDIWYKRENDGRAPEYAFLEMDYKWVGEIEATSLQHLMQRLQTQVSEDEEPLLDEQRPFRVGDVVQEKVGDLPGGFWIWTPSNVWATVIAFSGGPEETPGEDT